jgi:hypothetical protein
MKSPVTMAVTKAESGLSTVISGSSSAQLTAMESTPVSGVEMRKDAVAPLLAPCLRSPAAAGMTPQLHSGSGIPNSAALKTLPDRFCRPDAAPPDLTAQRRATVRP